MSIYGNAVRRPITTIMIFVGLMVMGIYSLNKLPIDFYPDIDFPAISVVTTYNGASAADIETNVTDVIESTDERRNVGGAGFGGQQRLKRGEDQGHVGANAFGAENPGRLGGQSGAGRRAQC